MSYTQRFARGIQRCFEVYDITRLKGRGIAVEREDRETGKAGVDFQHCVRAVIAGCYGDAAGAEEDIGGMLGGEAGGVG